MFGAQHRTRTGMHLRASPPQGGVSTNFTNWALIKDNRAGEGIGAARFFVSKTYPSWFSIGQRPKHFLIGVFMAITAQDIREFNDYLKACTDNQVRGVLEKEQAAGREEYVELAQAEMEKRGLN